MPTSPTAIPASGAVPDYNDRSTFGARVLAWDIWTRDVMVPGVNAAAQNVYNNAVEAAASAVTAAAQVSAAQSAATQAQAAASSASQSASPWVSGTTYAIGATVWSPINYLNYRRKVAGAGTVDPSLDATNWTATVPIVSGAITLYVANTYGAF